MLESFLAVLRGERPDRVVWTGDLAYWIAGRKQQSEARPEWDTEEAICDLHAELGLMPYVYYEKFWAAEPRYDASVDIGVQVRGGTATRTFCTPVGELREENFYSPTSCSTAITRYAVQSKRDLEVLLNLVEHRHWSQCTWAIIGSARLWRNYGGLPCIGLPRSPLSALCYEWAGVQNAVYLIADHEDLVLEVFERMEAQEDPILEAIGALAPPLVHFPDNLSSANLASLYAQFIAPVHRRRIERLHAAGVKCAVHLDGTVRGLLPQLIATGFDAIEALTPKPGGDLEIEEIRDLAGDSPVILWAASPASSLLRLSRGCGSASTLPAWSRAGDTARSCWALRTRCPRTAKSDTAEGSLTWWDRCKRPATIWLGAGTERPLWVCERRRLTAFRRRL